MSGRMHNPYGQTHMRGASLANGGQSGSLFGGFPLRTLGGGVVAESAWAAKQAAGRLAVARQAPSWAGPFQDGKLESPFTDNNN